MKSKVTDGESMLHLIARIIDELGLSGAKTQYDARSGTATITGIKDGVRCTTTLRQDTPDFDKKVKHSTTIGREAAVEQVKELYRQGYRQVDIAEMLDISQSTVSTYIHK